MNQTKPNIRWITPLAYKYTINNAIHHDLIVRYDTICQTHPSDRSIVRCNPQVWCPCSLECRVPFLRRLTYDVIRQRGRGTGPSIVNRMSVPAPIKQYHDRPRRPYCSGSYVHTRAWSAATSAAATAAVTGDNVEVKSLSSARTRVPRRRTRDAVQELNTRQLNE